MTRTQELDRMAEKLLACGLDPRNSLMFPIAIEDQIEKGNDDIMREKGRK